MKYDDMTSFEQMYFIPKYKTDLNIVYMEEFSNYNVYTDLTRIGELVLVGDQNYVDEYMDYYQVEYEDFYLVGTVQVQSSSLGRADVWG